LFTGCETAIRPTTRSLKRCNIDHFEDLGAKNATRANRANRLS
jgi:hypothetical protein